MTPVAELVGWTATSGKVSFLQGGVPVVEDAAGDTVINLKLGSRIVISCDTDLYVGYGRALTGDRWYQDVLRAELRYRF